MNGLWWILLLCCCGKNNGCGRSNHYTSVSEDRRDCYVEKDIPTCSLKERDAVWSPYMSNSSERDNDCGCDHKH